MFISESTTPSSSSVKHTNSGKTTSSISFSILWPKRIQTKQIKLINLTVNFMPHISKVNKTHRLDTKLHCVVEMVSAQGRLSLTPEYSWFLTRALKFACWQEPSWLTSRTLSYRHANFREHAKISNVLIVVTNCRSQCAIPVSACLLAERFVFEGFPACFPHTLQFQPSRGPWSYSACFVRLSAVGKRRPQAGERLFLKCRIGPCAVQKQTGKLSRPSRKRTSVAELRCCWTWNSVVAAEMHLNASGSPPQVGYVAHHRSASFGGQRAGRLRLEVCCTVEW